MTKASDNAYPSILITEGTEPSAPAAGKQRLYIDSTTHLLKATNSSGTDRTVEGLADPMTTRGDLIVRNASNVTARLGRGSASQVLTSDGTDVAWATPAGGGGITRTTVGTTSPGASFAGRRMAVKKVTLASAGLLSCIRAYIKGNGTDTAGAIAVLYSDSSGSPTNLIASGAVTDSGGTGLRSVKLNSTGRWMAWPVGVWLTAADYWIGVLTDDGGTTAFQLAFSSGTGSDRTVTGGLAFAADSSVVSISTGSDDYSIHADILR
jgi:hypothetical protein